MKSEKAMVNKTALVLATILEVILCVAYILELVKGSKTLPIFLLLALTDLVPMIICWVLYKMDNESALIRHVMAVGYGIFYACALFTTTERLVFVYAIPMFLIVMMYSDYKYAISIGTICSILATAHAIWFSSQLAWSKEAIAATEIEVLVVIVVAAFSIVTSKTLIKLNEEKMDTIDSASKKTAEMLESVIQISNSVATEVDEVSDKIEMLAVSTEETLSAMQEVSSGSTETAEAVQNQLYKTEEIQTQITKVSSVSSDIGNNVTAAVDAIHEGRDNIKLLMEQSQISEEAGKNAVKEVEELATSTTQMQSIVELIKSVATQTSLLALNASIEAARAGEAGRGFAVVATEISNLAGQTETATGNISKLIEGLSKEMEEVVKAINLLVESNKTQNESAVITQSSFNKIVESTRAIRSGAQELASVVTTLASANQEIVESVQTISAITEEVSAHSNTTCEASEQNKTIVTDIRELVTEMMANAETLKNMQ